MCAGTAQAEGSSPSSPTAARPPTPRTRRRPVSAEAKYAKDLISDLEEIEFNSGSDIREYTEKVRKLSKALAMELDYSAQELQARLKDLPPADGESPRAIDRKSVVEGNRV